MPHNAQTINYNTVRGLPFERILMIKDRRTHWLFRPTDARAYIKTGDLTVAEITCSITTENGIKLSLTGEETQDLPLGDLKYDVIATVNDVQQKITQGTISVSSLDAITPLETSQAMELHYKQRTDYRRTFTWKDEQGDIVNVTSAYMQAKNTSGTVVLDLRWFSSVPTEATIIALPEQRRGYLAPATNSTLELHISNANTIAAGTYSYDLFVQNSVSGDWDVMVSGNIIVESSISSPPA